MTTSASNPYPGFLELDVPPAAPGEARFHIFPVPYEKTVSYGGGTAGGPSAILQASLQLEAFNGVDVPARAGICTWPPVDCAQSAPEEVPDIIAAAVLPALRAGAVPVILGGEHTVTVGAVRALQALNRPVGIVQFDAHADLRDSYEGSQFSHACVARRIVEAGFPLYQIGIRSLSEEEFHYRHDCRIPHLNGAEIADDGLADLELPVDFPQDIYITFDIDAFDCALVPATGTPEPGGLTWYQALEALRIVLRNRNLIGFDVVELAPIPGMHASDYVAARLVYTIMGLVTHPVP